MAKLKNHIIAWMVVAVIIIVVLVFLALNITTQPGVPLNHICVASLSYSCTAVPAFNQYGEISTQLGQETGHLLYDVHLACTQNASIADPTNHTYMFENLTTITAQSNDTWSNNQILNVNDLQCYNTSNQPVKAGINRYGSDIWVAYATNNTTINGVGSLKVDLLATFINDT